MITSGPRIITISEVKAGTLTQCLGVAERLSGSVTSHLVPVGSSTRKLIARMSLRLKPEPDLIISCGRRSERPAIAMRLRFGRRPLTIHLQRPELFPDEFDLAFVSSHDWKDGDEGRANFRRMTGVPHQVTPARIAAEHDAAVARFGRLGSRFAVVLIGGPNDAYVYDEPSIAGIERAIVELHTRGWVVLASLSRRSTSATSARIRALHGEAIFVWDGTPPNPLRALFSIADVFVVTKDSLTMPSEVAALGKPLYTLELTGTNKPANRRFEMFHEELRDVRGIARTFTADVEPYAYPPLDESGRVAGLVEAALDARRTTGQHPARSTRADNAAEAEAERHGAGA